MICPYCGTHIADDLSVCPACHSTLELTMRLPKLDGTYCKTCGALIPNDMSSCPSCGMPVTNKQSVMSIKSTADSVLEDKKSSESASGISSQTVSVSDNTPADALSANTPEQLTRSTLLGDLPSLEPSNMSEAETVAKAAIVNSSSDSNSSLDELDDLDDLDSLTHLDASTSQDDEPQPSESEQTNAIPRIASALPANSSNGYAFENLPSLRTVATAAVASLLLVGCAVLYFTHPWAPNGYTTQKSTEADTSKAGFPGVKEKLAGQDSDTTAATTHVESADEQTYKKLVEDYKKLGELAQKTNKNVDSFSSIAFSSDTDAIKKAADEAKSLSYQTSNLISEIQALDTTTGTYVTQINNMGTLGNYLRNRLDIVNKAWQEVLSSENPSADKTNIMSILRSSQNGSSQEAYKSLFEQNYESWNPES
ncbi:zinc ribbon domain-containing protein [Atopobium fossor]|uniref:zinc ribbon domain-containing protein n=1 Tax=Atopobium fossor TaxID=39487 RepID=UPI00146FBF21|nr:zinc ribbon domain-containing protein [Atopobium fossor]